MPNVRAGPKRSWPSPRTVLRWTGKRPPSNGRFPPCPTMRRGRRPCDGQGVDPSRRAGAHRLRVHATFAVRSALDLVRLHFATPRCRARHAARRAGRNQQVQRAGSQMVWVEAMTRHVAIDPDELKRIVKEAVREELSAAGLRIDEPEHQFEAREDFRFLRNFRQALAGISSKVGAAVILAMVSGLLWLLWAGVQALLPPK
nr:MAG TPA: hypothetical protein [Caudoviricetes sp.]